MRCCSTLVLALLIRHHLLYLAFFIQWHSILKLRIGYEKKFLQHVANMGDLDYKKLEGLQYIDAVIRETLRVLVPISLHANLL